MQTVQAQGGWARSWVEESRVVAVQNPTHTPLLVLVDTKLWWYYEHSQEWKLVDTKWMSFETWQLMMGTARRVESRGPWQRPTF